MDDLKTNNLKAILTKTCSGYRFCEDDINYIIENFCTTFPDKNPDNLMPIDYSHDYRDDNLYFDLDGDIVSLNSIDCLWTMIIKIELSTTKKKVTGSNLEESNIEDDYKNLKLLSGSLPNISYTFYCPEQFMGLPEPLFLRFDNYTLLKELNDNDSSDQIRVTLSEDMILEICNFGEVYKIIKNKKCISGFKDDTTSFQLGDGSTRIFQSENKNKFCIFNMGDVSSAIMIQIDPE